jgi:hypothetical protein
MQLPYAPIAVALLCGFVADCIAVTRQIARKANIKEVMNAAGIYVAGCHTN